MPDERYTFETARIRLEEIAVEVRKKDTSLEKSLDLLEEGVRLANICTELVDHTDLGASVVVETPTVEAEDRSTEDESSTVAEGHQAMAQDDGAETEDRSAADVNGDADDDEPADDDEDAGDDTDDADTDDANADEADNDEADNEHADADDADARGDVAGLLDEVAGDDSGHGGDADTAHRETGSFDDTEDDLHEPGESAADD